DSATPGPVNGFDDDLSYNWRPLIGFPIKYVTLSRLSVAGPSVSPFWKLATEHFGISKSGPIAKRG
ncbi:MAG: hypothetical protein RIC82_07990, partial [Parvibaculum sp.]